MSLPTLPAGVIPPDYKEVLYWKVTQHSERVIALNLLAVPLALIFGVGFTSFTFLFGRPLEIKISGSTAFILSLCSISLVILVHELAHGIAMQAYGARPQYGFLWEGLMFYATAPGYAFRRNQYLVVALTPLVSISLLACLGILFWAGSLAVWVLVICAVINGSGAIGDLWISGITLRYPTHAYVIDERDGIRVFLPDKEYGAN